MKIENHRDFVSPRIAAATIACLRGAHTVRSIGAELGIASSSTAHQIVRGAARAGLVSVPPDTRGATRPGVGVVASSYRSIRPRSGQHDR